VEIMNIGRIKQKLQSPYLSQVRCWEDKEHFSLPDNILKGIVEYPWTKPSKI
jgi:hypothetical protein